MTLNNTPPEYIYNLPDDEKELLLRLRVLSDKDKQKFIEYLSNKGFYGKAEETS